jgi:excisionase family DNA binding protein
MSQVLYSVEQVAQRLGLHVKTVRSYVREGRLKAVRIGKQYRIAREDFEALTGRSGSGFDPDTVRRQRHVEASSIVEIDAIGPDEVSRVTNSLMAAAKSRRDGDGPLRVETIYDEERGRLKIVLIGGLRSSAGMFELTRVLLEASR